MPKPNQTISTALSRDWNENCVFICVHICSLLRHALSTFILPTRLTFFSRSLISTPKTTVCHRTLLSIIARLSERDHSSQQQIAADNTGQQIYVRLRYFPIYGMWVFSQPSEGGDLVFIMPSICNIARTKAQWRATPGLLDQVFLLLRVSSVLIIAWPILFSQSRSNPSVVCTFCSSPAGDTHTHTQRDHTVSSSGILLISHYTCADKIPLLFFWEKRSWRGSWEQAITLSSLISWGMVCYSLPPSPHPREPSLRTIASSDTEQWNCKCLQSDWRIDLKHSAALRMILQRHGADERISYARELWGITNLSLYLLYQWKWQCVIEREQSIGWERKKKKRTLQHVYTWARGTSAALQSSITTFKITLSHTIFPSPRTPGCLFITAEELHLPQARCTLHKLQPYSDGAPKKKKQKKKTHAFCYN